MRPFRPPALEGPQPAPPAGAALDPVLSARAVARALLARGRIMAREVLEEASRDNAHAGTAAARLSLGADAARLLAAADRLREAWQAAAEDVVRALPPTAATILTRDLWPAPDNLAQRAAATASVPRCATIELHPNNLATSAIDHPATAEALASRGLRLLPSAAPVPGNHPMSLPRSPRP